MANDTAERDPRLPVQTQGMCCKEEPFQKFEPLRTEQIALDVQKELIRARNKHPRPHQSAHEGISILREEFEEAEAEVFHGKERSKLREELIQVAAMAQRMIEDLRL